MKKTKPSRHDMIKASLPQNSDRVLLHSCCAPCSGSVIEDIRSAGINLAIYFYNPNIHPREEYIIRKEENIRYARKLDIPFIDADYDTQRWYEHTKGHERDPERGTRCGMCFEMRFVETARYAHENGFGIITSSLGISRWKDFDQVTRAGIYAASLFPGVSYWSYNWRKLDGSQRMVEISRAENFYKQEYCGCSHSLRDTNLHRLRSGREKIEIGRGLPKKDLTGSPLQGGASLAGNPAPQSLPI